MGSLGERLVQLAALKREALGQKHVVERYVELYDAFQKYAESLAPFVGGKSATQGMLEAREQFRLMFAEYESAFYEWEEGNQVINVGVAAFLNFPDQFRDNEESFRLMLTLATAKFEDLLKKAGRNLRELHEQIALEEGQSKAEEVTHVPSSALTAEADSREALRVARQDPNAQERTERGSATDA